MKKLLFLLLSTSLLACTNNTNSKEVFLFNNISFKLIEGESIVDSKHQITENYKSYFTNGPIQIPLLKSIQHKDYTIYIGVPYNTSIKKLIPFKILGQKTGQIELETDSLTYFLKKQNNDTTYISEFSKAFDDNLIYILTTTNSKLISDSLFKQTELLNRLIQK